MQIFEVSRQEQSNIDRLLGGDVFRKIKDGRHFIKVGTGRQKKIKRRLGISLTDGKYEQSPW